VAYLGRAGDMVNKWAAGALSVHIDVASGRLGRGRTLPEYGLDWHTSHPDNGDRFTGEILPDWDDVKDLCVRVARFAVGCRVVCWEVLLTDSGPRLIEGNLDFGLSMFQVHTHGLVNHEFGRRLRELGADLPDGSAAWVNRYTVPTLMVPIGRRAGRLVSKLFQRAI